MNMKILITTGIFPPDIGGPATYVPTIAKALTERGHQVTVLTTSEPENLNWDDSVHPFPVIRLNRRQRVWLRTLNYVAQILRYGKSADVIYANGIFLEAAIANKILRKPLVMKIVGDEAWERATRKGWTTDNFEGFQVRRQPWQAELLKRLRSWYVKQAERVIVPSRYLAKWVQLWGVPEDRIVVIYNALEPLDGVKPLPVPLATPVKAVTVGRLIPLKRVDQLLEAIARIPDLGLVVVGDGPERPRLEQLAASLRISDRVYFAGQRSREDTLGLMASCDFFVLNSTHEGLPHAVLEAMALGLPVMAAAVGGVPEVVRDRETGWLITHDNLLESILREMTQNRNLFHRLGEAAQLWVKDCFNVEQMIRNTEAILMNIAWIKKRTH